MRLTLSQWVRWRVSSMNAPKEYSLYAVQNWKRTPASTDGFAYHIEINMAKMGGIETCLFPWGTSSIPTDGNTSIPQTFRERLLCARPWVRCQGRATEEPLRIRTAAIWMADGSVSSGKTPDCIPGKGGLRRGTWHLGCVLKDEEKMDDSKTPTGEVRLVPGVRSKNRGKFGEGWPGS